MFNDLSYVKTCHPVVGGESILIKKNILLLWMHNCYLTMITSNDCWTKFVFIEVGIFSIKIPQD